MKVHSVVIGIVLWTILVQMSFACTNDTKDTKDTKDTTEEYGIETRTTESFVSDSLRSSTLGGSLMMENETVRVDGKKNKGWKKNKNKIKNKIKNNNNMKNKTKNKIKNKIKNKNKMKNKKITWRAHIYCSAYNKLRVFKNTKYIGGISTWKTYYHRLVKLRSGDVILVKLITNKKGRYGGVCSIQVEGIGKVRRFKYFSTGRSSRWSIAGGRGWGKKNKSLKRLSNVCYRKGRWNRPIVVKMGKKKCASYPYKSTRARYVWDKRSKGQKVVYLRYVHGRVRCKKPGKPNKPTKPNKRSRCEKECQCIALPKTSSSCYYWTNEARRLCDSNECGQKYKCVGPPKRGAMNCLSREVKYKIVPRYIGGKKCRYEKVRDCHVVPYDFPEGA